MMLKIVFVIAGLGVLSACDAVKSGGEGGASGDASADMTGGDAAAVEIYEIGPDLVPCAGVGPQQCMLVNGQLFYDSIEGFEHVAGQTAVIEVQREQVCDPKILNSCPQDASIYAYRMIRVISQN